MKGRTIVILAGVAVALVAAAFLALALAADSVLEIAIEKLGPAILKAPVRVKAANLQLQSGTGVIEGLVVGNPSGFKSANALRLTRNVIVVKRLVVEAPEITYEVQGGRTNLDVLKRNVDEYLRSTLGEEHNASDERGRKLIVDELTIRNGKVNLAGALPVGSAVTVDLPPIQLRGIGRRSGGVTPAELTKVVVNELTAKSARVAGATLERVRRSAVGALDSVREMFR